VCVCVCVCVCMATENKATGVMKPGMVFTIEPMINMGAYCCSSASNVDADPDSEYRTGKWQDVTWLDEWTVATADGQRSAQFEHTVLVTPNGYEVLTARTSDSVPFFWESNVKDAVL